MIELPGDWWEQLKREYPKRLGDNGWIAVRTLVPRALSQGATWDRVLAGTRAYRSHCEKEGIVGTAFVKQAKTFFGPSMYFDEWADMQPVKSAQEIAKERRWETLRERARAVSFRDPYPVESPDVYETQLKQAENAKPRPELGGVIDMLSKQKRA